MTKPQVERQGKVVVERADDGGFWVMLPNGQVLRRASKAAVERLAKRWFSIHNDPTKIGVGMIEWRCKP